ncbi:hypothetical protein Tco_0304294 [Tanacetum coccineum]
MNDGKLKDLCCVNNEGMNEDVAFATERRILGRIDEGFTSFAFDLSLPSELMTSPRVSTYLPYWNATCFRTFDLSVPFSTGSSEVEFVIDLHDLISYLKLKGFPSYVGIALLMITGGLDIALNLNDLLSCLVDDLWANSWGSCGEFGYSTNLADEEFLGQITFIKIKNYALFRKG